MSKGSQRIPVLLSSKDPERLPNTPGTFKRKPNLAFGEDHLIMRLADKEDSPACTWQVNYFDPIIIVIIIIIIIIISLIPRDWLQAEISLLTCNHRRRALFLNSCPSEWGPPSIPPWLPA